MKPIDRWTLVCRLSRPNMDLDKAHLGGLEPTRIRTMATCILLAWLLSFRCSASLVVPRNTYTKGNEQRQLQSKSSETIGQFVSTNGDFTLLTLGLTNANLLTALERGSTHAVTPMTLFAPDDLGIQSAPDLEYIFTVLNDPTYIFQLKSFMSYHINAASITSSSLVPAKSLTMENNENVTVGKNGSSLILLYPYPNYQGYASISQTDWTYSNGIVHLIDSPLRPSFFYYATALDVAQVQPELSTFSKLAAHVQLSQVMTFSSSSLSGEFTVFAPTNEAFAKLNETISMDVLLAPANADTLLYILEHHILTGMWPSTYLVSSADYNPLEGPNITVVNQNNGTSITLDGLATVVTSNLLGQNSIVYSIDTVLLPADWNASFVPSLGVLANESSLNSVAPSNFLLQPSISPLPTMAPFPTTNLTLGQYLNIISGYSSFNSALFVANLFNQTLQTTMQTTLFAPDNAAFSTFNATLASHLLENPGFHVHLQNLLLYHEVNGTRVSNLTDGMVLNMMNGEDIVVHMSTLSSSGEVTYSLGNDNNQIFAAVNNKPAVALANGIFYGIIGGLLLPSFVFHDLTAKIASLGEMNVFSNFISQSGLAGFLANGEYTVLAPLDSAWNKVNPSLIAELSDPSNIVKLQQVILYHVIPRVIDFAQIVSGSYTTSQGSDVVVTVEPDGTVAFGNNSLVVSPNRLAENGIIHEISQVLIPQFTPDWPTSTPLSSGPTVSPAPSPPPSLSARPSGTPTASPAPTITPMPTTSPPTYKSLLPSVTRSPTLTQPSQAPFVRSTLPKLGDYILSQENYKALATALMASNIFNLTTDAMQPMTLFGPR